MLRFKPSELAAGAFLVAQHVLMPDKKWSSTLTHYTGYSRDMALVPAKAICEVGVLFPCLRLCCVTLTVSILLEILNILYLSTAAAAGS